MCTELNTYVFVLLWSSLFFFLLQKRLFIPCCFWVEDKEPAAELKGDCNNKGRIIFWEVGFSKLAGKGRGGWRQGCEKQFCCEPLGILGSSTSQVCLPWLSLGFPKCSFPTNINPLSLKTGYLGLFCCGGRWDHPWNANCGIVWWWGCCSLFQSILVAFLHASEPGEDTMEQDGRWESCWSPLGFLRDNALRRK